MGVLQERGGQLGTQGVGCRVSRCLVLLILGLTAQLASALASAETHHPLSSLEAGACDSCSIYILDLAQFAAEADFPACDVEEFVTVNPDNGVVYLRDTNIPKKASHKFGTHSAPWYLAQAINNSRCVTDKIEEASVIYVYDYCYYIWWLAHVHSRGREFRDSPGDHLIKGWSALVTTERWKANGGRDYVFYDSHPGFVAGHAAPTFVGMYCNEFRHSMHIVVERPQRNVCQSYLEISKLLITPYVPNTIDTCNPLKTVQRPPRPLTQRDIFLFFKGRCTPYKEDNVGKRQRYQTVMALKDQGKDVYVYCSEPEFGASSTHEKFPDMLDKMERSVFCLVLPGDAQSTRRLSEIFMAGCIPVFVGPPYNSMPLPEDVQYASVGVFFNVTDYSPWMKQKMEWVIDTNERAAHAQEARWWLPDARVDEVMLKVPNVTAILPHLRGMPQSEVARKLDEMRTERHRFTFQENLSNPPNAVNALIKAICNAHHKRHVRLHKSKNLAAGPRISLWDV